MTTRHCKAIGWRPEEASWKILAAEKAALEVDSDTGYFLPEFAAS
jgi:hypothetical protein